MTGPNVAVFEYMLDWKVPGTYGLWKKEVGVKLWYEDW